MDRNTVVFMVLSGLCILPSCFAQLYHIVKEAKTWSEAQSYCREKYTDLVTINSEEDMVRLSHLLWNNVDEAWIGLYGDFNNWKWSLEREGFYEKGEAEYRKWNNNEPNIYSEAFTCGNTAAFGAWSDHWCFTALPFVCYNEFSETKYIYVTMKRNWSDAQSYCRQRYTDLASVRSIEENEEIRRLVQSYSWIGLYRESWRWSDGQRLRFTSFSNWNSGQPDKVIGSCVTTTPSKWNAQLCNAKYAFVCSEDAVMKAVVKVMLTKSDSSMDLEVMQDAVLEQLNGRLKNHNLGEHVKLTWITQPDGKVFHLKETEERKEEKEKDTNERSCIIKI